MRPDRKIIKMISKTKRKKKGVSDEWFFDKDGEYKWSCHKLKRYLFSTKTRFQRVEFVDTYNFGRAVILDNKIQSAEADEFIYHEALVHPAMITHPEPKTVLILGGGEGATLREALKHPTVKKAVMVDIDEEFIHLCKKHLKKWHRGSFRDKRAEVIFADAKNYVRETPSQFDVIIADISDPVEEGPGKSLYTKGFYFSLKNILTPEGIFVTHVTDVHYTPFKTISPGIYRTLTTLFPLTNFYYEYIPSFSLLWAYTIGSMKYNPADISPETLGKRIRERGLRNLSYYDVEAHKRLFSLPKCIRKLLSP